MSSENNIYKYRVGKKWFSFDKSVLEPEDLRVFEIADWADKLKIITIYKDLKPVTDDSVMLLDTKKENANKDKRTLEYNTKKRELADKLTAANMGFSSIEEMEKYNREVNNYYNKLRDLSDEKYKAIENIVKQYNLEESGLITQLKTLKEKYDSDIERENEEYKNSVDYIYKKYSDIGEFDEELARDYEELARDYEQFARDYDKKLKDLSGQYTYEQNILIDGQKILPKLAKNEIEYIERKFLEKLSQIHYPQRTQTLTSNQINDKVKEIKNEINELNIKYADVVNIQSAETVNITNTNTLTLTNVKTIIDKTEKQVKALETKLSTADFEKLANNINEILKANTSEQINGYIKDTKQMLDQLSPLVGTKIEELKTNLEQLKQSLDSVESNASYDFIKKLLELFKVDSSTISKIVQYQKIQKIITDNKISTDALKNISKYTNAAEAIKAKFNKSYDALKSLNLISTYINLYKDLNKLDNAKTLFGVSSNKNITQSKGLFGEPYYDNLKYENVISEIFSHLSLTEGKEVKFYLYYSENIDIDKVKSKTYKGSVRFTKEPTIYIVKHTEKPNEENVLQFILDIMNQTEISETEKPGAVEQANGFLGLRTNKQAKKEYEELRSEIEKLKQDLRLAQEEIKAIRLAQQTQQTKQEQITKPSFLNDIMQKHKLKPVDQRSEAQEKTDLEKLLQKRRLEIEYSDDSDDDWGQGLKVGGLLRELQNDLKHYGLVLSLSPDKNAFFVNVFDRKPRKANGIEEAEKIVSETTPSTEYKDLKKLYEQLY